MTPLRIIELSAKTAGILGVGQTLTGEDTADALDTLNMMLGQWAQKRWLVYHLIDVSKLCTGAQSYTVGPGGDFDTVRPNRLEAAFIRQVSSQVDYPLSVLESREDYNRISLKTLQSMPSYIWYDSDYPVGTVYPWPNPTSDYELHLTLKAPISAFPDLVTEINLPPEYQEALMYNLAGRLRPLYQLPPDATVAALAAASLNTIRNANAQLPRLQLPADLVGGSRYNIYSDRVR